MFMAEMEGLYLSPDRAQRVTAAPEETESGRQHGDGFRIILQLDERTLWRNIGEKVGTTLRRSPAGSAAVKKTAARVGGPYIRGSRHRNWRWSCGRECWSALQRETSSIAASSRRWPI